MTYKLRAVEAISVTLQLSEIELQQSTENTKKKKKSLRGV